MGPKSNFAHIVSDCTSWVVVIGTPSTASHRVPEGATLTLRTWAWPSVCSLLVRLEMSPGVTQVRGTQLWPAGPGGRGILSQGPLYSVSINPSRFFDFFWFL